MATYQFTTPPSLTRKKSGLADLSNLLKILGSASTVGTGGRAISDPTAFKPTGTYIDNLTERTAQGMQQYLLANKTNFMVREPIRDTRGNITSYKPLALDREKWASEANKFWDLSYGQMPLNEKLKAGTISLAGMQAPQTIKKYFKDAKDKHITNMNSLVSNFATMTNTVTSARNAISGIKSDEDIDEPDAISLIRGHQEDIDRLEPVIDMYQVELAGLNRSMSADNRDAMLLGYGEDFFNLTRKGNDVNKLSIASNYNMLRSIYGDGGADSFFENALGKSQWQRFRENSNNIKVPARPQGVTGYYDDQDNLESIVPKKADKARVYTGGVKGILEDFERQRETAFKRTASQVPGALDPLKKTKYLKTLKDKGAVSAFKKIYGREPTKDDVGMMVQPALSRSAISQVNNLIRDRYAFADKPVYHMPEGMEFMTGLFAEPMIQKVINQDRSKTMKMLRDAGKDRGYNRNQKEQIRQIELLNKKLGRESKAKKDSIINQFRKAGDALVQNFEVDNLQNLINSSIDSSHVMEYGLQRKALIEEQLKLRGGLISDLELPYFGAPSPMLTIAKQLSTKDREDLDLINQGLEEHDKSLRKAIRAQESSDNYSAVGEMGHLGAYQFDTMLIARNWNNINKILAAKGLKTAGETGIPGIPSPTAKDPTDGRLDLTEAGKKIFLGNKTVQEAMMDVYMQDYINWSGDKTVNVADYSIFHYMGALPDWSTQDGSKIEVRRRRKGGEQRNQIDFNTQRWESETKYPSMGFYLQSVLSKYYGV